MRTVILERNRLVGRRIARIWSATGLAPTCVGDPAAVPAALPGAALLLADVFDADVVRAALRSEAGLAAALMTAEPLDRALRLAAEEPRIHHIFGRTSFETTPRDTELALFARRFSRPAHAGGAALPFGAFLSFGYTGWKQPVTTTAALGQAVVATQEFVAGLGLPRRVAELFGELSHELLMNALYDAPVDRHGRPRYAHDRRAQVTLSDEEAATLRVGCDGVRLALQVTDPFGRLERGHVFGGLLRGLKGQMDTTRGGAGLGLAVCANATVALYFDVIAGHQTEVTGVFDLDLNLREFRGQAKSVHFFGAAPTRTV